MRVNHILTLASATVVSSTAIPGPLRRTGTVWVTPHEQYSSSVGVLGCMINSNRVAYWPGAVPCEELCIRLTVRERQVIVMHVDTSQPGNGRPAAHDISYDAWNILFNGKSAKQEPARGSAIEATYDYMSMSECTDILSKAGGKLPLSAANSMNYLTACGSDSWVGREAILINAVDTQCRWGYNEQCHLETNHNQATCPSGKLGVSVDDKGHQIMFPGGPVVDLEYGTGKDKPAL